MNASQLNKPEDINVNNKKTNYKVVVLEFRVEQSDRHSVLDFLKFLIAEAGNASNNAFKYQLGL